ncbi:protein kinase STUNTED [Elaeis guineensis]|uniref:Proline-rich receptor-like protein kinase PERK9 n=1 Tax=Elaeis guineensis var. tenera TaxID=51953 RepID=A0A6I9QL26_ELAGV|nr:proline-rich receptor-like protein kinase PERK9 [Elaeis guineensis]
MKMTKGEEAKKNKKEAPLMGSEEGEGEPKDSGGKEEVKEEEKDENEKEEEEEEEEGVGEGKTVLVGVKMDAQSRELLTWALVKVAAPGDRVVALHVLTSRSSSTSNPEGEGEPTAVVSLAKDFDDMVAVYEGFCNLKQIDLKLKICKGSSVRKVLAREVNEFAASKLILGVAKRSRTIGLSSFSIAKYCAKKLHFNCLVLAVNNGKIVFQKQAADKNKAHRRNSSKGSTGSSGGNGDLYCLLPSIGEAGKDADDSKSSLLLEDGSNRGDIATDENATMVNASPKQSCSICDSVSDPPSLNELKEDESPVLVLVENSDAPASCSVAPVVKETPGARSAWPLLRRPVFSSTRSSSSHEWPKISVVQWALRLPSRYSAVHPYRKSIKSNANVTPNSDKESSPIVPVGTDSTPSISALDEEGSLPKELESLQEKYSSVCRLFSHEELVNITSNFSPEKLIGKGGCSRVYKGCLSDGKEVAVKILKPSEDALRDFVSEIEIVAALHHKNIISLIGFCFENNCLILVSDYLSRGSLEEVLHGEKENKNILCWATRYKVALGVAEALDYLHGGSGTEPVIHRDVKSSNILLSEDFEPQLSDFGLANWASASASNLTSNDVAGTFGYLAPEYFMYGKVNEKIDVYAFGVVLLELLSGRKPISMGCPKGAESLVMWAKPILQGGDIKQLVDPCLGNEYDSDQMERMTLGASLCIRRAHQSRPQIASVLKLLQGDDDVVKWARSQISTSEGPDELDEELDMKSIIQSHLNLALLDVDDDSLSISSTEQTVDFITTNTSTEDYLKGRWSRSSSFN